MIKKRRDHFIGNIKELNPRKIAVLSCGKLGVEVFHDILSLLGKLIHRVFFVVVRVEVFDAAGVGLKAISDTEYLSLGHRELFGGFHGAHGF